MNIYLISGLVIALGGIIALSIYSGAKGQKGGSGCRYPVVAGLIMGTLVGGSSTVGTAQLAYTYGMSAWWFTLGAGIGCLIMALLFIKRLRGNGSRTLVGMIRNEYGEKAGLTASILSSVGMFINIISQTIAATAIIAVVFPDLSLLGAALIAGAFMILYVIFGGTKGAGMVGVLKLILLYISMVVCGGIVLRMTGGISGFVSMVHSIENPDGINFFSLFARGAGTDLGAGLSLVFGVLTTQTYAQAVLSASTERDAFKGAMISAFLIPPIGIAGILVGLYMRANFAEVSAKIALTSFVMDHTPSFMAGIILGTLFITVVGTGAGVALGIATIVKEDIVFRISKKWSTGKRGEWVVRISIIVVLLAASMLSTGALGDIILNFAFMSMGLRGAVVFAPLVGVLWFPGKIDRKYALAAIITGPACVLLFNTVLPCPIDPLFIGIISALLIMGAGLMQSRFNSSVNKGILSKSV